MISPLAKGAIVGDPSLAAVAKNTIAFLGGPVELDVQPPDLSLWPGKFAILSPGNGELWVQNRTGFTVAFTYHVMGPPWTDP